MSSSSSDSSSEVGPPLNMPIAALADRGPLGSWPWPSRPSSAPVLGDHVDCDDVPVTRVARVDAPVLGLQDRGVAVLVGAEPRIGAVGLQLANVGERVSTVIGKCNGERVPATVRIVKDEHNRRNP